MDQLGNATLESLYPLRTETASGFDAQTLCFKVLSALRWTPEICSLWAPRENPRKVKLPTAPALWRPRGPCAALACGRGLGKKLGLPVVEGLSPRAQTLAVLLNSLLGQPHGGGVVSTVGTSRA